MFFSHIENENANLSNSNGYNCPQCGSRYCELPVECKQCGLTLVSAPHLARSYHHLFPIKPFIEREQVSEISHCFACAKPFGEAEPNVRYILFTQFITYITVSLVDRFTSVKTVTRLYVLIVTSLFEK